jgi:hypothetical protein
MTSGSWAAVCIQTRGSIIESRLVSLRNPKSSTHRLDVVINIHPAQHVLANVEAEPGLSCCQCQHRAAGDLGFSGSVTTTSNAPGPVHAPLIVS